jgi:hypothetical protein
MRKITLLFALALALVLAIPGAVGQLARAHQETLVAALADSLDGGRLTSSVFEAGWFTSRAVHRIEFDGPAYLALERSLTGQAEGAQRPALIVDSRLAHGPWPGGGGGPAFMTARSELTLAGSDGLTLELPGQVSSRIGFTGDGESRFESPGLSQPLRLGSGLFQWDGADITVRFERNARALDSTGRIGRLVLTGADGELILGEVRLEGRSRRSGHGFWTGASELQVERLEVVAPDGSVVAGEALRLDGSIEETDDLVDLRFRLQAGAINGGAITDAALAAEVYGIRLDAAEWGRYLAIRRAGGGDAVDFARLTRAGPRVGIERLTMQSPDGELAAAATLEVPVDSGTRGPLTALGAAVGEGALTVDAGLLARLAQSGEPLRQAAEILLALGYLRAVDGRYAGEFALARGVLTVNGQTLALPF